MSIRQISVFLENRPGSLLEMTSVLAEQKVDMRAFSLAETSEFGIARIIVDDVDKTSAVLKSAGYVHSVTPVIAVAISNTPGGLNQTLSILGSASVNIEYMYAFVGRDPTNAYMVFRVANVEKGIEALRSAGLKLVEQEDLATL